ncbi:super-infection exclusion protein B [Celerinatantimonas sp. MCCC 1A17872]|uniref:super-infection exclusion protein B n=1 Tax=Celerinatantimonas sp. MCCC 1A17872 TaxID=3177514 RepID=UPI0038C119EB
MRWLKQALARLNILEMLLAWCGCGAGFFILVPQSYWPVHIEPNYFLAAWAVALVSLSYFVGRLFLRCWAVVDGLWRKRLARRNMESLIQCLDHTERAILREFVIRRTSVLKLPVAEPAVVNLLDNGVLEMNDPQQLIEQHERVECMISLAARPLLSYRVLALPVGNLTEEQLDKLKKMRPAFLQPDYQANRTYSGKVFRIRTVEQHHENPVEMPAQQQPPIAS